MLKKYPELKNQIIGKSVLDFGCGEGRQAKLLKKWGALRVVGIEPRWAGPAVVEGVLFKKKAEDDDTGAYDFVFSQDVLEHVQDPEQILQELKALIKPGVGKIFLSFGPLWYAPYGSHMNYFTRLPWVQLFFSEEAIMRVRLKYRNDGARKFSEVPGGLNQISLAKFEKALKKSGLTPEALQLDCVKRMTFFSKIPYVRELFVNQVVCVLKGVNP